MNQIMPVGKGVLVAFDRALRDSEKHHISEMWRERFPDVPVILIAEAQIVIREDETILFEFTGDEISPTFVAEFQRWWEEVNHD